MYISCYVHHLYTILCTFVRYVRHLAIKSGIVRKGGLKLVI